MHDSTQVTSHALKVCDSSASLMSLNVSVKQDPLTFFLQLQHVWTLQVLHHITWGVCSLPGPLVFKPRPGHPLHPHWHPGIHSFQTGRAGGGKKQARTETVGLLMCQSTRPKVISA